MKQGERQVAPTMLHIGCGNTHIDGWVNIDRCRTETTDRVAEAWDMAAFDDGSVGYIYTRHMLEHLSCTDARRALTAWRKALSADGILHIVVPDIAFHARQLLGLERSDNTDQEAHALAGFYGWQRDMENDIHRWGYTPESLSRLLSECGFAQTDDGIKELIDHDTAPWHINLRARPALGGGMIPGERQVAPTLDGIRRDHVARYEWAANLLDVGFVIDVACGIGYGSKILADAGNCVMALDRDEQAIDYAKKHYPHASIMYECFDVSSFVDGLPDVGLRKYPGSAVCFETIEHLKDPRPLLKALCKSAPYMVASVPNEDVMPYEYEPGKGYAFHYRHYTKAQFDALLNECGWSVTEWHGQEGPESEVEPNMNGRTLIAVCERAEAKPAAKPTKIAICGGAPSSAHLAPYDDPTYEIWVHGNQIDRHAGKRITRIFEIHDDLSEHGDPLKYAQMLVDKGIPMVVGAEFPIKAPHVEVYPFDAVNNFMGEHLTSTPSYMMGYAMLRDFKEIMIYGCDMAVDDHEYFYQRPVMYAWIGLAIGRGIKIGIPKASSLFKDTYVEGRKSGGKPKLSMGPFRESEFRILHDKHGVKMADIQDQIAKLQLTYAAHNGCQQAYEKMGTAARAVESGQVIDSLTQTTVVI